MEGRRANAREALVPRAKWASRERGMWRDGKCVRGRGTKKIPRANAPRDRCLCEQGLAPKRESGYAYSANAVRIFFIALASI